jgi:predicted ArsR family transcriptional regulator
MTEKGEERKESGKLHAELVDIKKLLMLIASKSGATQPEIGKALGVGARQVRKILEK